MGTHRRSGRQRPGDIATTTAALLLAAGESSRMGDPKPLLSWAGMPLIEYQVNQLVSSGVSHVVVVLGNRADQIRPSVPAAAGIVVNEQYAKGRATSLRAGARALPNDADPIAVLDIDRPRPARVLRTLLEAHGDSGALISRPVFGNEHGHPIVVAGALLEELRNAEDASMGLLGVVDAHRDQMQDIEFDDPAVLVEFNTREEYQDALAKFGQPAGPPA